MLNRRVEEKESLKPKVEERATLNQKGVEKQKEKANQARESAIHAGNQAISPGIAQMAEAKAAKECRIREAKAWEVDKASSDQVKVMAKAKEVKVHPEGATFAKARIMHETTRGKRMQLEVK